MTPTAPRATPRATPRQAFFRRALALTLLVVVATTALGVAWGQRQDAQHEATAVILLNPLVGSPFSPDRTGDDLVNLETEAHLVTSDAVARLVRERSAPDTRAEQLLEGVAVKVPPNTQLLEITTRATSAVLAAERAQAFAQTYLDHRKARAESELFDRAAQVEEQIRERSIHLEERAAALARVAARSPRSLLLQQEIIEITSQVGQLRTQRAALQAQPSNPGQVVTPAAVEPGPVLGWTVLGGAAGLVLGLGLGLGAAMMLAVARTRRSATLRDEVALTEALAGHGVPLLGRSDAPHEVRTSLLVDCPQRPLVVLLATLGAAPGADAGARDLATSFARAELETVLVEIAADGEDDGLTGQDGLSDLLQQRVTTHDLLDDSPHVPRRIGAGRHPDLLDDLASSPRMGDVVEELRKGADIVILSGGDLDEPRTLALVPHTDAVLLATASVTLEQLDTVVADLRHAGRSLAGALVVVRPRHSRRRRAHA